MTQPALPGMDIPGLEPAKLPPVKGPLDKSPAPIGWLRSKGGKCRTCQAAIVFALLTKKKGGAEQTRPHPFDLEPDPDGTTHLVAEGRTVRAYLIPKAQRQGRTTLHKSHFTTCPQAALWRKGEAPDEPR